MDNKKDLPIAVMDSGLGGISVLREPLCKPVSTKNTTKEISLVVLVISPLKIHSRGSVFFLGFCISEFNDSCTVCGNIDLNSRSVIFTLVGAELEIRVRKKILALVKRDACLVRRALDNKLLAL